MTVAKKRDVNMCEGPLLGKIWRFTLPLVLMNALQLFYNAADMIIVGRYDGDAAVAAVGATSPLINLIVNVFIGMAVGVNVCIGGYIGAGKDCEAKIAVDSAAVVGIVSGVGVTALGLLLSSPLLRVMGTPDDIFSQAILYSQIYFLGAPANLFYNFMAAVLRAKGDTKRPLYILSASGAINLALNVVFVAGLDAGVAGVAWATVISQYVSAIIVFFVVRRDSGALSVRRVNFHKESILKIIGQGIPSGLQGSVFSLSTMVIQSAINSFQTAAIAGNTAAGSIDTFSYIAFNAFQATAVAFAAQNYGAKRLDRVKRVYLLCIACASAVAIVTGWLIYLFAEPLLGIYLPGDADAIAFGIIRLKYICLPYFILALMDVTVGILRGMGSAILPTVVSIIGSCGIRLMWVFTVFKAFSTPDVLYISFPLAWLVTLLALLVSYFLVVTRAKRNFAMEAKEF